MAKLTGMVKRGSVYWLRVRVPKDLVSALKKREITFSLRTSDRKEAETKAMAERLRVQLDFGMHRRGQSQPVALKQLKELSPEEIQDLVLSWFHDLEVRAVREDAASPTPRGTGEHHELLIDLRQDMASMHAELSGNNHPSDPIWADKPISDILSAKGIAITPGAQSREQLRRLILRGLMEARRRMHVRLGGGTPDEKDGYFTSVDLTPDNWTRKIGN